MLTQRSKEKEILDLGPDFYSVHEFIHCQKMLFQINKLLGIFRSTVKILRQFPHNISLLDIGCGGGLFLLQLSKIFPQMQLTGLDISEDAIHFAKNELMQWQKKNLAQHVVFQLQQQKKIFHEANSVDVILANLVCHHLTDEELIDFFKDVITTARQAVIINDLQRHTIAEQLYKLISPFFRNRLITHDGLISIRRSFTRKELHRLLQQAQIKHYEIHWQFPFRWSIILWKK